MGLLRSTIDFILYTNLWISGSASALYIYSSFLLTGKLEFDFTALFIMVNCTWLYSLHRFIGLQKIKEIDKQSRFHKIDTLKTAIQVVGIISLFATAALGFTLTRQQLAVLVLPGIMSLLYVLPILTKGRRLRDLNYLKIFVISIVWAMLTVALPSAKQLIGLSSSTQSILFLERFLFIFAITLPFDIRDLSVDKLMEVKTIPAALGINCLLYTSDAADE